MDVIFAGIMARPIRVEYANAVYHVTARGNERTRKTFREWSDGWSPKSQIVAWRFGYESAWAVSG